MSEIVKRDKQITELQTQIENLQRKQYINEFFHDLHTRLIDENVQYSKKVNLIITGMDISKNENNNDIRQKVLNEIDRLRLDIDDLEVDRAHRYGTSFDKRGKNQQQIIVRFTTWTARDIMYKARKNSRFFFAADITKRRQLVLESARAKVDTPGSLANQFVKFVYVDNNCLLTAVSNDDRHLRFSSINEFDRLPIYIESFQHPLKPFLSDHLKQMDELVREPKSNIINLRKVSDMKILIEDKSQNVYVGRPNVRMGLPDSKWKNPFSLNDYDIETCLEKFENHVRGNAELMGSIDELRNKNLLCFCDIQKEKCHAQILNKLISESVEVV